MRTCAGYPPDRCPGQTGTLPPHPAAAPATGTARPGVSPALPFPHAAEDGPVSTRPVGVGVGGKEHGPSPYRGTARQLTTTRDGPGCSAWVRESHQLLTAQEYGPACHGNRNNVTSWRL